MRSMSACPGLVVESYNPRYWEAEAGVKDSLGCRVNFKPTRIT